MNKKILSLAVPCYQSAGYVTHCIESLLPGGEAVEILLINDGSTDETAQIIDDYAARYPTIVKAFHQQNKGHGGAVNTGIEHATGTYFKVVDSDDWLDEQAYAALIDCIEKMEAANEWVDMIVCNYVYEKEGSRRKKAVRYPRVLKADRPFPWDEVGRFRLGQYLLMHSVVVKTDIVYKSQLKLPCHCFYVDNLYVFACLAHVESLWYLNVDLYRYYTGREGQSVQEKVMIARIDQQIKVNKSMVDSMKNISADIPKRKAYLLHYLGIITVVTTVMLTLGNTPECDEKKLELWNYIKTENHEVYKAFKHRAPGLIATTRGRGSRGLVKAGYRIAQRFYGFN